MKRLLLAALLFIAVVGGVVFLVPDIRLALVGTTLRHRLQPGSADELAVMSILSTGNEIRQLTDQTGGILTIPTQEAKPESYDLRMGLEETVENTGSEEVLRYRIREVRSEQLGTTGGEDLTGSVWLMRALPTGLVVNVSQQKGQESRVLEETRLAEILAAAWPGLPKGLVRPGSTWTARWDAPLQLKLMKATSLVLQHRLNYHLEDFSTEGDVHVARIHVTGEVVPTAAGEPEPGTVLAGTGRIEGTVVVDVESGRTLVADDRTAWSVVVRYEEEGLEVVHFSDRNTRLWRPALVTDGQTGFQATLPVPGESPAAGAP